MALFVENACKIDADTLVDAISWSPVDPIAAIACTQTDEKRGEKFLVLFTNNEVS
jgi:hypothetical protein